MALEEPEKLLAIQKAILRMAEDEAARRGGEQIDRDLESDEED